ncbi:MAG: DUF445 domain-containing protein [Acidimicrobiales bacterium]|nr:DUF445 domain-containing protein [Acidimicrobiales bacterium]MBO0887010.1 DUF445 domain-containing protein [Acidimicrobiales bacterium]MBO0893700.1 DUF445 domain-containing protein [Acidimicrobiales bacterium]
MDPSSDRRVLTPGEQQRAALLVVTRRRATGLLVAVTLMFALSTAFIHRAAWLGWPQAVAVASMVGGLADWFAVTALFRRPLGLPIPHTAIVVERKDRFAATIGSFVQENFLTPEAVTSRLQASGAVPRTAAWMADADQAAGLAGRVADLLVAAASLLRDEDAHQVVDALLRQRVDSVALAPVIGRTLEQLTREGRHEPVMDTALGALAQWVPAHREELHRLIGTYAPWWLPNPISGRMVGRLIDRTGTVLDEMAHNRDHPLRQQLHAGLEKLADQLQTDEAMRRRGEELKAQLLSEPAIQQFAAAVWRDVKDQLRTQAAQPGSELRAQLTRLIAGTGQRLRDDPALAASAQRGLDTMIRTVLGNFDQELRALVSGTIARWDAVDTARRLELLLGPDLQYIRINGTVFGALAGLILHAIAVSA